MTIRGCEVFMRILPVIDILHGTVVRGVAGNRSEYRPIQSHWTDSAEPLNIAAALRDAFGFQKFYVADLDGILSQRPNVGLYRELSGAGFELLIDAGIRDSQDVIPILKSGATGVIAGLETLRGPEALRDLITHHGPERIVFSLDLKSGIPSMASGANWSLAGASGFLKVTSMASPSPPALLPPGERGESIPPDSVAATAYRCGARQMIVLDLADVGTGTGGSTAELCRQLSRQHPELRLITGGGVRGPEDLAQWSQVGVTELLVASALHDGRLSPEDVRL